MSFDVQIMFGGMLAFVQPSDNQGMMVLAPDHSHHPPIHRLVLKVGNVYQPQVIPNQGPVPAITSTGWTTTAILPLGYEMSIVDGTGAEIPLGGVPLTRNVIIPEFGSDAEILDSGALSTNLVHSKYLAPIGSMTSVPVPLSFRARLRSGSLQACHTMYRQARTLQLTHNTASVTKRLLNQALFEKNVSGAHLDLSFRSLRNNGDSFVIRFLPQGAVSKIFLELGNDTTPLEFCNAASTDPDRVKHSVGAFAFLNPPIVPVALPAHQFDSHVYESISDDCAALPPAPPMNFGGNKPAVCFPISVPSTTLTW